MLSSNIVDAGGRKSFGCAANSAGFMAFVSVVMSCGVFGHSSMHAHNNIARPEVSVLGCY